MGPLNNTETKTMAVITRKYRQGPWEMRAVRERRQGPGDENSWGKTDKDQEMRTVGGYTDIGNMILKVGEQQKNRAK